MSETDSLLERNEAYASGFDKGGLPRPPARRVAVVACMDARLLPARVLGLNEGDAHVIRNPGGVVTDAEIKALAISQKLLGTEEVIVIGHTDCGLLGFDDEDFAQKLENETGQRPAFAAHGFADLEESVRKSIATIKESPFIPHKDSVRGFVYEVETGRLREVS